MLLLGGQQAVVIDGGARGSRTLLQALDRFRVSRIVRLIVSHNHADHAGGTASLLSQYPGKIDQIWLLQDTNLLKSALFERITQQLADGILSKRQLHRLERDQQPKLVYADPEMSLRLLLYSPRFAENLQAQKAATPNATSAILSLDVGNRRVLFAADSEISQWRQIRNARNKPLDCDIVAVPHHAGGLQSSTDEEIGWLFSQAIRSRFAVVSVGTSNTHGHPRENVIRAITASGTTVLCTQITQKCHSNLEALRPGVLLPNVIGRSSPTRDVTASGNSRNLACAGTIVADVTAESVEIQRIESHQRAVDQLATEATGCPLCRS